MVNNSIRSMEFSFALGNLNPTDIISFYSKEKLITDGEYLQPEEGESHLGADGGGSGFAPQIEYWPNITFEIVEGGILLGDVNADGIVNVLDVVLIVTIILDNDSENNPQADLNEDGIVNVIDIVALVNIILNN